MFVSLQNIPEAVVCVDRPIKDIAMNPRPNLFQRLLLASTAEINPSDVPLCGQLYCVRGEDLRQIAMAIKFKWKMVS